MPLMVTVRAIQSACIVRSSNDEPDDPAARRSPGAIFTLQMPYNPRILGPEDELELGKFCDKVSS